MSTIFFDRATEVPYTCINFTLGQVDLELQLDATRETAEQWGALAAGDVGAWVDVQCEDVCHSLTIREDNTVSLFCATRNATNRFEVTYSIPLAEAVPVFQAIARALENFLDGAYDAEDPEEPVMHDLLELL